MVEWQREDQVSECGGTVNVALDIVDDSSDMSDDEEEEDDDLTTDGVSTAVASVRNEDHANFGNIAVKNCTDIHFGNKTFYQGPVTIKQFVYASGKDASDQREGFPSGAELTDIVSTPFSNSEVQYQKTNGIHVTKDLKSYEEPPSRPTICLRRRHVIWITTAGVAVVLVVASLLIFLPGTDVSPERRNDDMTPVVTRVPPSGPHTYKPPESLLRVVPRSVWVAQPPTGPIDDLAHPVPYVIILHTAADNCSTSPQCIGRVRDIQNFHIETKKWFDIAYNFLVGGDGNAYEGRGWDKEAAHAHNYNPCSIGIAFIGTFDQMQPPKKQMAITLSLIEEGVKLGKIRPDYRLLGHRQVSPLFTSPGEALFSELENMAHFSNKTTPCVGVIQEMDETLRMQTRNDTLNSTTSSVMI